jgi:hypothetical protein
MAVDFQTYRRIYNRFDPFRPLPAGDPAYVNCNDVRGDSDILIEIGSEIVMSDRMICQLYAGHLIMVQTQDNRPCQAGMDKMKEVLAHRVHQVDPNLSLEGDIFAEVESLEALCLMSGGHVRNLLLLVKEAMA